MENKVFSINLGNVGSTGKIMRGIANVASDKGFETYLAYPKRDVNSKIETNDYIICNSFFRKVYEKLDSYIALQNCLSIFPTLRLIHKINHIHPDIIHLHNIHGGYVNIIILFEFLKKKNFPVIWTLHDCWAFTGRCPHFVLENCNKWKTGCYNCTYPKKYYPAALWDHTKFMWKLKRKLFTSLKEMTIITPSQWLADLVNESYLHQYCVKVINNGIDLEIFKPTQSKFRSEYKLEDKFLILGVSCAWGYSKGMDVFIDLAERLDDRFKIVLVGTNDELDCSLPKNILSIHRTNNQLELAEIYSSVDVFINPTRQDTFPTVNIESLACGTPVITFKTGGSPEILNNKCGKVVECNNVEQLEEEIINMRKYKIQKNECIIRAQKYNQYERFDQYVNEYRLLLKEVNK